MGKVLAVTEIEGVTQHGDRIALEWQPLAAGHPLYDAYIGRPDPLANQSQIVPHPPVRLRLRSGNRTQLRARPRAESYPGAHPRALRRVSSGAHPVDRQDLTRHPASNPTRTAGPQAALSGLRA